MDDAILKVLEELEALPDKATRFWNVPRTTGQFLNMMVRVMNAKKVLEIGTSNGYSGIFLAEALAHTGGLLYTVESHEERFGMARENFAKAGMSANVHQVFGHAPEILLAEEASLSGPFDLIFVDATKVEYKSYAEVLLPRLRSGGLMIADNCISHRPELGDFLELVEHSPDAQNLLLSFDNGLLLSFKL